MKRLLLLLVLTFHIISYNTVAQEQNVKTVVQTGHMSAIKDYDVSADSRFVATLDKSNKTILWNLRTGHQFHEFNEEGSKKIYFNSRSTALVVVCKYHTKAFDIETGKCICYWDSPNSNLEIKRIPKSIRCVLNGNSILVMDATSDRKLAELKSMVDPVYCVVPMRSSQKKGKYALDDLWWVIEKSPVQWNLKSGKISNIINFADYKLDNMWLDAIGDLVFWNGKNLLSRFNFSDGKKIDDIRIMGQGTLHTLTFLSDNNTVVYDRNNRIWNTNISTHHSDSLPFVDYLGYIPFINWKGNGNGDVVYKERHYRHGPDRESIKAFGDLGHVSKVVGLGSMKSSKEYFIIFNDVWAPLKMKLGSTMGTTGGNMQDLPKSLYRMGNGLDIVRGSFMISLLSDLNMVGKYADDNVTCASLFGNDMLATAQKDGSLRLFDRSSSRIKELLNPHNSIITSINQGPSQRIALTTSNDGTVGVYDTRLRKLVAYLISSDNGREYIIRTPDNYYMSSRYGTDAIHFVKGTDTYRFDQFDLKYNRPDIVLSRIGLADEKQINMLKHAYEKRLRRMHFTEEMLSSELYAPTLFIKNNSQITQSQTPFQTLQIEAIDSRYKIISVNAWVNGVPVFGIEGKKVEPHNRINIEFPISLTRGHNSIQVSCMNERGVESFRQTVETDLPTPSIKPDLWIVTLGVSQYEDKRFCLKYAAKDAEDLAQAVAEANRKSYQNVHILTLTDHDVNKEALDTISAYLSKAVTDDAVILSYAGHGLVDQSLDYYLGTYDTDFTSPSSRSISYDDFESLLDGIKPLQKLLLIDACHSGEIDKDDILLAQADIKKTNKEPIVFRSAGDKTPQATNTTAEQLDAILFENFSNLTRGSGATIISSSSGLQVSVESDQWENGLFSYCFIQGLRDKNCDSNGDGKISIGELQRYCQQHVFQLSRGRQRPSSRIENRQANFIIGSY